ncbi:MAG: nucleotidyltransferase family protein [Planctomycetota bacterium]
MLSQHKIKSIKVLIDDSIKPFLYKRNPDLYVNYEKAYIQNKLINLVKLDEFKKLIKKFSDIILLKGLDLSLNYYKDLGIRPFEDIDILITHNHLTKITHLLEINGYKRFNRTEKLNSIEYYKYPTKFHIHTSLNNAIYPQPYLKKFDEELQNFILITPLDNSYYKRLEENFNFLYITFHSLKHNFDTNIRIIDIIETAKFVNWQKVYQISRKLKCYDMLITTLNLIFSKIGSNVIIRSANFIKNHSGLDLFLYLYLKPLLIAPYLALLSKNFAL